MEHLILTIATKGAIQDNSLNKSKPTQPIFVKLKENTDSTVCDIILYLPPPSLIFLEIRAIIKILSHHIP